MTQFSPKKRRKLAWICLWSILLQILTPIPSYALTSGPNQPEFSSFEPVATTNMVNEFTGDFTYNLPVIEIPGPEGSGYALSLSYHSGTSPEEEASWVGYGWTLNPGAIIRSKQGFPDDFKGEEITYHNDVPKNWTVSCGAHAGNIEGFSMDVPLNANAAIRFNNYKGFGYTAGIGLSYRGITSLGYNVSDNEGSFSLSVNPAALLADQKSIKNNVKNNVTESPEEKIDRYKKYEKTKLGSVDFSGSDYGLLSKNWFSSSTHISQYEGFAVNVSGSIEGTSTFLPVGPEFGLFGSYSQQVPEKEKKLPAYGYMYAGSANSQSVQDYYLEKDSPYHKRDKFMAIPFSNPDQFSVTSEGLGGGFRLYNQKAGHFFPNYVSNPTSIINVGAEFQAGANVGAGADIDIPSPPTLTGYAHTLSVEKWAGYDDNYTFASQEEGIDEPVFFRFKNDLGGNILFGDNDDPKAAEVSDDQTPDLSNLGYGPRFQADGYNKTQYQGRVGRSTYIGYHINKDMMQMSSNGVYYQSYNKDDITRNLVDRNDPAIENGIGEFIMTNEDGNTYTFGLPIYARNEANLQYGFKQIGQIENGHIVYQNLADQNNIRSKVGEERKTPYATTFLLTSITSPDYIDRNLDGPTTDDFGGYTRFAYKRLHGGNNKSNSSGWYRWRMPYNGFFYNRNSLSDKKDDICSVIYGEKEVYYLDTIETKTHVAIFYASTRSDGISAAEETNAAFYNNAHGTGLLMQLDSITLHAKNPVDGTIIAKWLQRVNFRYSYELMPNLPNSNEPNHGKLTLKKIWTDYNGTIPAKIAPYLFEYQYPTINYPAPYSAWSNYANYSSEAQNPAYSPSNLDSWGNYHANGSTRHQNMRPWLDQRENATFDPAAWQLKNIKLPSGGQIHVQYEQKEYQFVQNRRAMAMVSLIENPIFNDLNNPNLDIDLGNKFYLNLEDLDIFPNDSDYEEKLEKIAAIIKKEFIEKNEKIYFKFLYAITGVSPDLEDCNSEFITGYAKIDTSENVGIDNLLDGTVNRLYVKLGTLNPLDEFSHPRRICIDYAKANVGRTAGGDCDPEAGLNTNTSPSQVVSQLLNFMGTTFSSPEINCLALKDTHSYLRIPLLESKKGGGVRVKRLLMYDQSLGETALYGNEYIYETKNEIGDIISSGVALNEPSKIREECALVTNLEKRTDQGFLEKIFAGVDKNEFEGPLGETILPSASIGYSKVIVKNIHSGRTSPGFTTKEFYTAKDYPFDHDYEWLGRNGVAMTEIHEGDKEWLVIPAGLFNYAKSNLWLTQGYSFIQNDFHGKLKRLATYSGPYTDIHNPDAITVTSEQQYEYFQPGQKIPVSLGLDSDMVTWVDLGKETEVVFESKKIEDIAVDQNIEGDLSIGLLPIPPNFPTAWPSFSYSESKLHTHVTVKIVSYPAIVKAISTNQDGITSRTENLRFSRENGRPLLTRTTDGYNGLNLEQSTAHQGYYSTYRFAAADIYPALSQRALNEQRVINANNNDLSVQKSMTNGNIYLSLNGSSSSASLQLLNPGDLVQLNETHDFYHIGETIGNTIALHPLASLPHIASAASIAVNKIKIIQAGKSNRLNEDAGKLTVYGNKIDILTGTDEIIQNREAFVTYLNGIIQSGPTDGTLSYFSPVGVTVSNNKGVEKCCQRLGIEMTDTLMANVLFSKLVISCSYANPYSCTIILKRSQNYSADFFQYNPENDNFLYFLGTNPPILTDIGTCGFCAESYQNIAGVVDVNLSTYSDAWGLPPNLLSTFFSSPQISNYAGYSPYETGARGKWRPNTSYVYREGIISGIDEPNTTTNNRVYKQAGTFTMELFDWVNLNANDPVKWLKINQTNLYSPHGQAIEEENIQGIKSAVKYGYSHNLPYLVAQNADYNSAYFESFENRYSINNILFLEEHVALGSNTLTSQKVHSGKQSLRLKANYNGYNYTSTFIGKSMNVTQQMKDQGVRVSVWINSRKMNIGQASWGTVPLFALVGVGNAPLRLKANVGEWRLYEALIPKATFISNNISVGTLVTARLDFPQLYPTFTPLNPSNPEDEVWIDDLRIQPADAQMTCFVYDPATYRLLTSFDDQHFGLFYQYNAQGSLTRKLIETQRGLKTVQEAQYHLPTQQRN